MRDYNYPIYFLDGSCIACGSGPGSVIPINKFGYASSEKNKQYPISTMVCRCCGREYFIKWKASGDNPSELDFPIPVSRNYIDEFAEFVKRDISKSVENN